MTETETSAGEAVAGDGVDDLVNEVLKCFMHREYVRIQLKDDQTMNEASNPHRRAAASFNHALHRMAAPPRLRQFQRFRGGAIGELNCSGKA
jgi:hypothetical protein